ncbi:MAG TPA: glycosyltransferase family 4 protein [Longimicrobiaceae bacterium]|nr:glycosyltransferase family 4 protein [Longimicrobiaceae bacterium]
MSGFVQRGTVDGGLRVLITNCTLATRTGTELYVRDLAIGLLERGHSPVVYSPFLGPVAEEIRAATIPVTSDLASLGAAPDVIHGHHWPETLTALLAFPGVPALAVCHSWVGWRDIPFHFPRVLRYVAVDHTCRDRLRFEHGIPEERIRVVLNAVDLDRFRPRAPLPPRPRRALVFSNLAGEKHSHLPAVKQACAAAGIHLDVVGAGVKRSVARPEEVLPAYDLVFAKARSALEALAVGAAVVLCDSVGAGPMVTTANLPRLRPLNFGMRTLRSPVTPSVLGSEIARYDAADAAEVSHQVRESAGRDAMLADLVALYREVVAEHRARGPDDLAAEQRAAAAYLQSLAPRLQQRDMLRLAYLRMFRTPVLGWLLRAYAARPGGGQLLAQIESPE